MSTIYYATKANSHPDILRVVHDAGLNLECVSAGEVEHVLTQFPEIDRQRILFTPNFAPRGEYEYALGEKVWVTLDNLHPLVHWPELFADRDLFLRLDTGQARGHHRHVRTQGSHTKFGIPVFEIEEVRRRVESCGATVVGLHAHSGSGILESNHWSEVAAVLADAAERDDAIDMERAEAALVRAEERIASSPADMDLEQAMASLRRARVRVNLGRRRRDRGLNQ